MPPDPARKLMAFSHSGLLPQTINPRWNTGMVDFKVVRSCSMEESLSFSSLTHHDGFFFQMSGTADILRCYHWFPRQVTSEKQAQKFHTGDASVPSSG